MGEPRGAFARTIRALRHRNFRLFFFGQLVSLVGSWMQSLAQGWLVWRLSGSTFLLGVVGFCQMAPVLVLGLIGGVVADRFDRHRIVIATQAAALVQATLLATVTLSGTVQVWHVMALALLLGTINAFDMPGRQAFLVQMVERADLANAIALNSSIFNGARIVGPALAGIVVRLWGEGVCFAMNAVSYLAVLGSLLAMRLPARSAPAQGGDAWSRVGEGLRYAWDTPHVRALLSLMAVTGFFGISYISFLPAYAGGLLGSDAGGLGLLMSFAGLGALAAAMVMAQRSGTSGLERTVPATALGFGICLAAFSFSESLALSCVLITGVAFCMMMQMAGTNTLLQSLVPDALRGRLMSLYTVTFIGMSPIGSLVMGRVSSSLGLRPVLAGGAVLVVLGGVAFYGPLYRSVLEAVRDVG
jgi:MFS family permease